MKKNKNRADTSPTVPQKHKIKNEIDIHERELNEKQKQFLELALDKKTKLMFVSGPAGTSKTYMAILSALKLMNEKKVSDLLYLRSAVESSDSKIGFLPGEANEKMAPYIQPLIEKLTELTNKATIDWLQKEERIESIPIGFLRGLNWNARCIVADEAQNMTYKELVTLVTRVGEFSKVFVIGDPEQSDINLKSGFVKMISNFDDEESRANGIHVFEFTEDDIVRSELVKFIIKKLKQLHKP
jgi:phosphate starvation-inducible PhoH-like protein